MSTIALCLNTEALDFGNYRKPELCRKIPGGGWIPYFIEQASRKGHRVLWGSEAYLSLIEDETDPKDTWIIQEEENVTGERLRRLGATPKAILCLESPIFAPRFYDRMEFWKTIFPHQFFFQGGTETLCFPSFDAEMITTTHIPWKDRKQLVMVSSNKHYRGIQDPPLDSPSYNRAIETQLHDHRYQGIGYFKPRGSLDLFGQGWPPEIAPACEDKLKTIRSYKFSLCLENGQYPGYVTEKLIDCLVAEVVPLYLGAPDIHDYFPSDSFIDLRQFTSWSQLQDLMDQMSEETWREWVRKGTYALLFTQKGWRFSYPYFANALLKACLL